MDNSLVNAKDLAKEQGLFLKVVVSVKSFDTYNSFFNIYGESEEPCRRILVLTPYEELEEVIETNSGEAIEKYLISDGNLWIEEYPLITNPKNINLDDIKVPKSALEKLKMGNYLND